MREYINIGSSPCEEDCVQVGAQDYVSKSRKECQRFINKIREICGVEPEGAQLATKSFPHDFGTYHEVVCYFDMGTPSEDYAYHVESYAPTTWTQTEKNIWRKE